MLYARTSALKYSDFCRQSMLPGSASAGWERHGAFPLHPSYHV
jgi:hypothetical protein